MSKADSKPDIGVAVAENVRHAEIVAHDAHVILRSFGNEDMQIRFSGLAQPIRDNNRQKSANDERYQRQPTIFDRLHGIPHRGTVRRAAIYSACSGGTTCCSATMSRQG